MSAAAPLKVVVAADAAMSRDVVRFFLKETDFEVVGDAVRAEDAAWMAQRFDAEAVVVHSGIAFDEAQDAVRSIRRAAPRARIVVLTPEGGTVPMPVTSRGADSYLEEGVGLVGLALVLRSLCRSPLIEIDGEVTTAGSATEDAGEAAGGTPMQELRALETGAAVAGTAVLTAGPGAAPAHPVTTPPGGLRSTWRSRRDAMKELEPPPKRRLFGRPSQRSSLVPLVAAAAAFVLAIGMTLYRVQSEGGLLGGGSTARSGVVAGDAAGAQVFVEASLNRAELLALSLRSSDPSEAPTLAQELVTEHERAVDAGADQASLDRQIEDMVAPALDAAPDAVAVSVLTVLAPAMPWAGDDLDQVLTGGDPGPPVGATGSEGAVPPIDGATGPLGDTGGLGTTEPSGSTGPSQADTNPGGGGGGGQGAGGGDQGGGGGGGQGGGELRALRLSSVCTPSSEWPQARTWKIVNPNDRRVEFRLETLGGGSLHGTAPPGSSEWDVRARSQASENTTRLFVDGTLVDSAGSVNRECGSGGLDELQLASVCTPTVMWPELRAWEIANPNDENVAFTLATDGGGSAEGIAPPGDSQWLVEASEDEDAPNTTALAVDGQTVAVLDSINEHCSGGGGELEDLELDSLCTPPELWPTYRSWLVTNPNDEDVAFTLVTLGGGGTVSAIAPPGESVWSVEAKGPHAANTTKLLVDGEKVDIEPSINEVCDAEEAAGALPGDAGPLPGFPLLLPFALRRRPRREA